MLIHKLTFIFFQAGPLERVSIPKDGDKNRQYAFITYKYQVSVPYALSVFSGTKLFNRELRLNNRNVNKNNSNSNSGNNMGTNQFRGQAPMEPQPILPNAALAHPYQMQNPFGNAALRGSSNNNPSRGSAMNNMMPQLNNALLEFPQDAQIDYQTLLAFSAQMLSAGSGLGSSNMGNYDNESQRPNQSKMMHRHENRTHNQNNNYSRDRDRRNNDRRSDRTRSRSRDRNDWMRNNRDNNRSDRRDRNNRGNDNNRRRN